MLKGTKTIGHNNARVSTCKVCKAGINFGQPRVWVRGRALLWTERPTGRDRPVAVVGLVHDSCTVNQPLIHKIGPVTTGGVQPVKGKVN